MRWSLISLMVLTMSVLTLQPLPAPSAPTVWRGAKIGGQPSEAAKVWGVFVESAGLRFVARLGSHNQDFLLVPDGNVIRNDRPSRISDLKPGDRMLMSMVRPGDRWVSQIQATSRVPESPGITKLAAR